MEEDTGAGAGSAQGANQANAGQETGAETGPGRIQIHQYVEDNSSLCEVIVGETGITTCGLEKWMTAVRDSVAALMGSRVVIPDDMMQGFARNRIHQLLVDKLPVREILCRPGGSVTTTSAENEVAMLTGDSCAKCLICQQELQSGETRSRGQSCHLLSCTDDLRPRGTATGKAGVQQETGEYCEVFCDCGKFFHRDCLKRWVVPNKNCPWCRGKIIRVLTLLGDDADEVFGSGVRVGGSETAGDSRSWIACELPSDFLPSTSRSDPEQQPASSSSGQQAASSSVVAPSDLMHDDMVTGSSSITHPSNDPSPSSRTSSGASSTGGDLRGGPSSSSSRTALAENLGALVSSRSQASRPSSNQGSRPSSSFSRPFFVTPPPADTEASGSEDEEQPVDTWSTVPAWILGMMGGTARERERANGGFMADSARTPGDETLTHDGIRTDIEGMAQQARRAIAPSTNSSHRSDARAPPGGLSQIEASPCEYLPDTQELFGTESELEEPTHGTESCPSLPGHGYDAESQPCAVQ
ncbi:unnamed protein product [Amoebophrya sp. A25]|nr:unnamed protein product [Amoebophrya sp. A25]|eukprot:GSA25T00011061001.1